MSSVLVIPFNLFKIRFIRSTRIPTTLPALPVHQRYATLGQLERGNNISEHSQNAY